MEQKKSEFDKVLGAWDILVIAFGAMIGWGWVVSSGSWIQKGGVVGASIAFAIGGVMIFFIGLTYAELTAAMPQCGGEHVFSYKAMGPNGSFICTWAIILGYVSVTCFEACAFPTIITSWNSFMIGGSRALYSMAESYMIPPMFAKLHPQHKTPINALFLIGALTMLAPFAGRGMMVWICDAGNFGCCLAYCMVSLSFLILRKKEPDMPRPYRVPAYKFVGTMAVLMSGCMVLVYCIPGSGGTLVWQEWLMVGGWSLLGVVFFAVCKFKYKEKFGSLIELISDEDAASLMPEADDAELDVVIDAAIDRVLAKMAG